MRRLADALDFNSRWTIILMSVLFGLVITSTVSLNKIVKSLHDETLVADKQLKEFETSLLSASYESSTRLDKNVNISFEAAKQRWSQIWEEWQQLKHISPVDSQQNINSLLSQLEVVQWRGFDYQKYNLTYRQDYFFTYHLTKENEVLFKQSTELIELLKTSEQSPLLYLAANFRGYITNASKKVAHIAYSKNKTLWFDYFNSFDEAISALNELTARTAGLPSIQSFVRELNDSLQVFESNVLTYKTMSERANYYSTVKLKQSGFNLTNQIIAAVEYDFDRYVIQQNSLLDTWKQRFWLIIVFIVLSTFVMYILLNKSRHKFADNITKPIEKIVSQTSAISSGTNINPIIDESEIIEVSQLVTSINKMANQLLENKKRTDNRTKLQKIYDEINKLSINSPSVQDFCDRALTIIIESNDCLSGALFLGPTTKAEQLPELFSSYNLPIENIDRYKSEFKGIPFEVFKSHKPMLLEIPKDTVSIVSATKTTSLDYLYCLPLIANDQCIGVLELYSLKKGQFVHKQLNEICSRFALQINLMMINQETRDLLINTQRQKEQLDMLTTELQSQTESLQQSETELEMQAEELKASNEQIKQQQTETLQQKEQLELLNKNLANTAKKLEAANQQKSIFLAKVNHELKSPLNSILMLAQTMLHDKSKLPNSTVDSIHVILESGRNLLTLINDLIDLAQIQGERLSLKVEPINVKSLANLLQKQFAPIAQSRGLDWKIDVEPSTPDMFETDGQRLAQILRNFLSNAFKFTHEGRVKLIIRGEGDTISFLVEDTGIGIPEKFRKKIFEAFQQVDDGSTRSYGGTGLGLSISALLAIKLGGQVNLERIDDGGSRFILELPVKYTDVSNSEKAYSLESKKDTKEWVLCAKADECPAALKNCKELPILQQVINFQELLSHSLNNLTGVIIYMRDVKSFGHSDLQRLQQEMTSLQEKALLVIVIESKLPHELEWLNDIAYKVIKWNKQAITDLKTIINNNEITDTEEDIVKESMISHSVLPEFSNTATLSIGQNNEADLSPKDMTLLLVDDDMRNLFSLSLLLKNNGYDTVLADSVALAKDKLVTEYIDGVLTDLTMPNEDGYSLLEHLQQKPYANRVTSIVLTATDSKEVKERCEALGADAFFAKPIENDMLINYLNSLSKVSNRGKGKDKGNEN